MRTKSATENADVDHYYVKDCGSPAIITPLTRFLSRYDSLSSVASIGLLAGYSSVSRR